MENNTFNIHDRDSSTGGGPPGWMAFGVVSILFLLGAILMIGIVILVLGLT